MEDLTNDRIKKEESKADKAIKDWHLGKSSELLSPTPVEEKPDIIITTCPGTINADGVCDTCHQQAGAMSTTAGKQPCHRLISKTKSVFPVEEKMKWFLCDKCGGTGHNPKMSTLLAVDDPDCPHCVGLGVVKECNYKP